MGYVVIVTPDTRPRAQFDARFFFPLGAHIIRQTVAAVRNVQWVDLNLWYWRYGAQYLPSGHADDYDALKQHFTTLLQEDNDSPFRSALLSQIPPSRTALLSREFASFSPGDPNILLARIIAGWLKKSGVSTVILGGARCKKECARYLIRETEALDSVFYHEMWSRPNESDLPTFLDFVESPSTTVLPQSSCFWRSGDTIHDLHNTPLIPNKNHERVYPTSVTSSQLGPYAFEALDVLPAHSVPDKWRQGWSATPRNCGILPLKLSDGCANKCAFCDSALLPLQTLSPVEMVNNIEHIHKTSGVTTLFLLNRQLNLTPGFLGSFCRELIKRRLDLVWSDSLNLDSFDPSEASLLYDAGCRRICAGIETVSPRMRRYVNRGPDLARVERGMEALDDSGIWLMVNLIVGLPGETWAEVVEARDFLRAHKSLYQWILLSPFKLYPNSLFADHPERFGLRLLEDAATLDQDNTGFGVYSFRFEHIGTRTWEAHVKHTEEAWRLLNQDVDPVWQQLSGNWPLIAAAYSAWSDKRTVYSFLSDVAATRRRDAEAKGATIG